MSGRFSRLRRLFLFSTLDRYVLRKFCFLYAGNLLSFTFIYVFVDLFENLGSFADRTDSLGELLVFGGRYYAAVLPVVFCQLLGPVVALASGLFAVTLLHRANELVPMLSSGLPCWRIFRPILAGGAAASAGAFLIQELWIPSTADVLREVAGRKEGEIVREDLRFLDAQYRQLIVLKSYNVLERRGYGVTVIPTASVFRDAQGEQKYIRAREMRLVEPVLTDRRYWLLRGAQIQTYDAQGWLVRPPPTGPPGSVAPLYGTFAELELETSLLPEEIEAEKEDSIYMRLEDLRRKMDEGVDRRWVVKYYSRLAQPLSALILLLVGLPLLVHYGSRNIFFGAVLSAIVATAYFVFASMASHLALRGTLPGALGAWLAPLSFASLGIAWLRYVRS